MFKKLRNTSVIVSLLGTCISSTVLLCVLLDKIEFPTLRTPKPLPDGAWLYPEPSKLLDLPRFKYLINNDVCKNSGKRFIFAVLIITSHAGDVQARTARRKAFPETELLRLNLRQVFLLAVADRKQSAGYKSISQRELMEENKKYGDLVQGDFHEAYRNLSYKHVMGLKWASRYCSSARFVFKMDDDIAVNVYKLLNTLPRVMLKDDVMAGYVLKGMSPERDVTSKWMVTNQEWPQLVRYPTFLSGWFYATTPKVAEKLVDVLKDKFFWIDDVFVTGVASSLAEVSLVDVSSSFSLHVESLLCCLQGFECDFSVAPSAGDWGLLERYLRFIVKFKGLLTRGKNSRSCVVTSDPNSLPLGPGTSQLKAIRL